MEGPHGRNTGIALGVGFFGSYGWNWMETIETIIRTGCCLFVWFVWFVFLYTTCGTCKDSTCPNVYYLSLTRNLIICPFREGGQCAMWIAHDPLCAFLFMPKGSHLLSLAEFFSSYGFRGKWVQRNTNRSTMKLTEKLHKQVHVT